MKRWPWLLALATAVLGLIAAWRSPIGRTPWFVAAMVAMFVGAFLISRVPENLVGRLLFWYGAIAWVSGVLPVFFLESASLGWADAVGNALNTAALPLIGFVFLRFPSGRLLSSRWRRAERFGFVVIAIGATSALLNGGWGGDVAQSLAISPLKSATEPISSTLAEVFFPLLGLFLILAVTAVVVRAFRAEGVERQQIKWLAYGAVVLVVALSSSGFNTSNETWEAVVMPLALSLIPVAIGIAVLRYRLYDIDVVLSRTLVFGAVAAFITSIYAVIVVGVGRLFDVEGSNLVLSVISTAIVALAFEPFRLHAQRWANRLVYGTRATPYEVLSDLTSRLSRAESLEGLLDRMAERLAAGTGAQSAVVWSLDGEVFVPVSGWPVKPLGNVAELAAIPGTVVAIPHDGATIGALSIVKSRAEAPTGPELALLDDLAGSAALVMGKLRLDAALEQRAQELTESRRRLVTAQETERRRLERDLHDGAQQLVVSLKVKLGIAAQVARSESLDQVADLLEALGQDAQLAIDEIRSLAKGIYPPLLEAEGLPAAVRSLVASAGTEVSIESEVTDRFPRDVESAIYYCISEAVTNAAKHAPGSLVEIQITADDEQLAFSVADSGPGFNGSHTEGSGLRNMRDRVEALGGDLNVRSRPQGGAIVEAKVRLRAPEPVGAA